MLSPKISKTIALFAKWLANESHAFDSWLLIIAVLNWGYCSLLSRDCRGIAPWDWHCWSQEWYAVWNRLLFAALCLRTRKTWICFIGLLISLQIVAAQLFYLINPDEVWQKFVEGREYLGSLWRAVIEHELLQGIIAALMGSSALHQIMRRLFGNRPSRTFACAIRLIILILSLGHISSFISHAAAERATAQWLYRDILKGSSFYGDFLQYDWLKESARRFESIGANVIKADSGESEKVKPWATVGPSAFTGPFLISVRYEFRTIADTEYGNCLVFDFFGFIKILDKDSQLYGRLVPYLFPY
jgi:hypothetical protein